MSYPKTMTHPNAVKAVPEMVLTQDINGRTVRDYTSVGDRLPPVTVMTKDQEDRHRAMGYVTEDDVIAAQVYQDYPVWLAMGHQEVLAHDEGEELSLIEKGYARKGQANPEAVRQAYVNPYDPNAKPKEEWPKLINGVLVDDPSKADDFNHYPMWVGDKLVNSEAEERAARNGFLFRDGKLVGDGNDIPVIDPRREALLTLATLKGVAVKQEWTADEIEAALYPAPIPTTIADATKEIANAPDLREALIIQAEAAGISVDKRWGVGRLREALLEAAQ